MAFPGNANWACGPTYGNCLRKALGKEHCKLGRAHFEGEDRAVSSGMRSLESSACEGDADGQYELGRRFDEGIAVERDLYTAIGWYEKAARQGHAKAMCTLGWCYSKGHGVKRSESEAFSLFMRAAELKLAEGQFNLGVSYAKGIGCARDGKRALEMYRKAAAQKHRDAMINIGMEIEAHGGGQPGESAVEWYELASKEGSEKGRYHAARCYHEGVGGAREDRARAADVLGASVWELGVRRDRGVAAREREKENERGSRVPV